MGSTHDSCNAYFLVAQIKISFVKVQICYIHVEQLF